MRLQSRLYPITLLRDGGLGKATTSVMNAELEQPRRFLYLMKVELLLLSGINDVVQMQLIATILLPTDLNFRLTEVGTSKQRTNSQRLLPKRKN